MYGARKLLLITCKANDNEDDEYLKWSVYSAYVCRNVI